MKSANCKITDIKEKNGLYVIGVEIKAGRYKFHAGIAIRPIEGDISVDAFKNQLKGAIIKRLKHIKAVEPIKRLQKESFIVEYENTKS